MEVEAIYWIFSTTAQSISALIAFLLTGYIYKISTLNQRLKEEETSRNIIPRLKIFYNKLLKILLLIGGISVVVDIISLYYSPLKPSITINILFAFSAIISLSTILFSIIFIWALLDEDKEMKIAKDIYVDKLSKKFHELPQRDKKYHFSDFMDKFIKFEDKINRKVKLENIQAKSLNEKIWKLGQKGKLPKGTSEIIKELILYRNLLVHKGVEYINPGFIDLIENVLQRLDE